MTKDQQQEAIVRKMLKDFAEIYARNNDIDDIGEMTGKEIENMIKEWKEIAKNDPSLKDVAPEVIDKAIKDFVEDL